MRQDGMVVRIALRATFAVACERILMAREERGLYP